MKVLMLTPTYFPIVGGSETAIRLLALGLNSKGIQTDIMTFNMPKTWETKWRGSTEISEDGFRIFRIPALNWYPLTHSDRITMTVNVIPGRFTNLARNYDMLHYHTELSFPLFSYLLKKPKIFHFHGMNFQFLKRYFLPLFLLTHTTDLYISLTERMKLDLVRLGIPEHKIKCLPNGIDVELFHPSNKKEEYLLLFVGRISFNKGLHVLLESLRYLKQSVRLVIIGPSDFSSRYFTNMLDLIRKENKEGKHKIEYIGEKNQKELVDWYQRASVFILPSIGYEGLGIVNLEASACETPIVATNTGGIPEVVRDGENGILVKPKDAVELASAIQYLLDNERVRKNFGKAGRRLVVEQFSTDVIVRRLIEVYTELAETAPQL